MCASVAVSAVLYGAGGGGGDSSCEHVRDVAVKAPRIVPEPGKEMLWPDLREYG